MPGKRALSTVVSPSVFVRVLLLRDFIPFSTRTGAERRVATCDTAVPADFLIAAFADRLYRAPTEKLPFLAKANTAIRISLWRKQRREPGKP